MIGRIFYTSSLPLLDPALKRSPFLIYFAEGEFERDVKSFIVINSVTDLTAEQVLCIHYTVVAGPHELD